MRIVDLGRLQQEVSAVCCCPFKASKDNRLADTAGDCREALVDYLGGGIGPSRGSRGSNYLQLKTSTDSLLYLGIYRPPV
jgi:hypothetical protein